MAKIRIERPILRSELQVLLYDPIPKKEIACYAVQFIKWL
jgi:hypothetical protein